jgi:hypothetical protein
MFGAGADDGASMSFGEGFFFFVSENKQNEQQPHSGIYLFYLKRICF